MKFALNKLTSLLPLLLTGLLLSLSYPNPWFEGHLAFSFIAWFLFYQLMNRAKDKWQVIGNFLGISFFFNLINFSWIAYALSVFAPMPYPVAVIVQCFHCLVVLIHLWPLVIYFALYQSYLKNKLSLKVHLLFCLWIHLLSEQFVPQLFGVWMGHSTLTTLKGEYLSLIPYMGVGGYSLLILLCVFVFFYNKEKKIRFVLASWLALILVSNLVLYFKEKNIRALHAQQKQNIKLRLVQGNIGNFQKIQAELGSIDTLKEVYDRYYNYSLKNSINSNSPNSKATNEKNNSGPVDLIIWPETAVPDQFDSEMNTDIKSIDHHLTLSLINSDLKKMIHNLPAPLLLGAYDHGYLSQTNNGIFSEYNSTLLYRGDKLLGHYHKHLLLPFGETLPFGPLNPWLYSESLGISLFSEGRALQPPIILDKPHLVMITPICYEILKTSFISGLINYSHQEVHQPVGLMVNPSNDSWYGISAEPRQHLFLSRFRTLEHRLPLVRMTNTGITALINDQGQVEEKIELGITGSKDVIVSVDPKAELTWYARYGILSLEVIMLFISITLLIT